MKTINKFLVSTALLCLSQTAFAACDDADAYADCVEVTGDENDSIGSGTGGGGSLGFGGSGGGGSDGGSGGGNGGGGGANTVDLSKF